MSKNHENRQSIQKSLEASARRPKTARNVGVAAVATLVAGGLFAAHHLNQDTTSQDNAPKAVDVGNNVIYPTAGRVNHTFIESPKAKGKGEEVVIHFAVDEKGFPDLPGDATLGAFAYDVGKANGLHKITSAESAALTTQAEIATDTLDNSNGAGTVNYGEAYYVKVTPKTNLHDLEVFAKQEDISVKPV